MKRPKEIRNQSLSFTVKEVERNYILQMLSRHQWNRSKVAGLMGISRRTLFRKLTAFDI
jgi:transcriptional regulator with PAS, ATPase and Fis domain